MCQNFFSFLRLNDMMSCVFKLISIKDPLNMRESRVGWGRLFRVWSFHKAYGDWIFLWEYFHHPHSISIHHVWPITQSMNFDHWWYRDLCVILALWIKFWGRPGLEFQGRRSPNHNTTLTFISGKILGELLHHCEYGTSKIKCRWYYKLSLAWGGIKWENIYWSINYGAG